MLTAALPLLMVVAVAEFLIGLVGNGVLMVWSFGEWVRKFNGSSYNLIVLGLAGCRFLLQCLIMMDLSLFPFFQSSRWLHYLSIFWILVSQASLWFATFLSVFYCRKIMTLEHPVCLWLKQRAYFLSLRCPLVYLMISLLFVAHTGLKPDHPFQGNSSILYLIKSWHYLYIVKVTAGSGMPVMVVSVYSGMLIVSMYRHHKKMEVHTAGRRDGQNKAHITVLKSSGCFLIVQVIDILASAFHTIIR
nr:bitter taste receptor T2R5 [Vulpes vulpes]